MFLLHRWNAHQEGRKFQHIAETMERYQPAEQDRHLPLSCPPPGLVDCDYQVEFSEPSGIGFYEPMTVRIVRDGKTAYSWHANKYCAYLISGDQLVFIEFRKMALDAAWLPLILRQDNAFGEINCWGPASRLTFITITRARWRSPRTNTSLFVDTRATGDYIEVVNFATGKTVAHRVFPSLERPAMPFESTGKTGFAGVSGPDDGLAWQDGSFSVIVAHVVSVSKSAGDTVQHTSHTVVLEPFTTIAAPRRWRGING